MLRTEQIGTKPKPSFAKGPDLPGLRKSHCRIERPPFECIALMLQGGGALGAYQAGVYQALFEANLALDWVAGISIGAINAALIAGNPPEARIEKLRAFWEQATTPILPLLSDLMRPYGKAEMIRELFNQWIAANVLLGGAPGFFEPRVPPPCFVPAGMIEATSYYDTAPLQATLEKLVDFDRINTGRPRFSVGAVNVRTGNFVYFDSTTHHIQPKHVMASGALPPGFPAIEIDGEHYWDGGLVSNTPLRWVVDGKTRLDTLAFQVDLWSARGPFPGDIPEVLARQKEIQYSSRTRANTDQFQTEQCVRIALANLLEKLPPDLQSDNDVEYLRSAADRKVYKIVQLIYHSKHYEKQSLDYEFSRLSMEDHWEAGYNDGVRTLRHPEALSRPTRQDGVETFDIASCGHE